MMFDFENLIERHELKINGIIHVGAHECGEVEIYSRLGIKNVVLIEANPYRFLRLKETLQTGRYCVNCSPLTYLPLPINQALITKNYIPINAVVCQSPGEVKFHLSDGDGGADSIYEINEVGSRESWCNYKHTDELRLRSSQLNDIIPNPKDYNFLNIDVEGAELDVLKSYNLEHINYILLEVQSTPRFTGSHSRKEVSEYLVGNGFKSIDYYATQYSWGDELFFKYE